MKRIKLKIYFQSLGCDKNLSDSEHMLGLLSDNGYEFTSSEEEADIAIVNTCCFIGDAKKESIDEILRLASFKDSAVLKVLIITGCLSERYREDLLSEIPEIDGALGINDWDRLPELLSEVLSGKKAAYYAKEDRLPRSAKRILSTGGSYGYLKIAEGCNKFCTYCIIPHVRGRYRSVPMEELLSEARDMAEKGVRELILVAQETTVYGTDLYGRKMLPDLLWALSEIPEIQWIRILYCYPEEITPELINVIRDNPKVLHYLDIPVQHASDRILKKMNRRTNLSELKEKIFSLREQIPDIALRTTLITGFPGESHRDFKVLLRFVNEIRFERLGVFTYSREEGTPASLMKRQVPEFLKKRRRDKLMSAQQKIAFEKAAALTGTELQVIIEGRVLGEENVYQGRTYMDAPEVDSCIFIEADRALFSGDIIHARVTSWGGYDLIGVII